MSYDWREYLTLAGRLEAQAAELGPEAACYRSAASRAYYAAYHRALDLAGPTNYVPPTTRVSVHAAFRKHLIEAATSQQEPQSTQLLNVSNKLSRLWGYRKSADYDDEFGNTPEELASLSLTEAKDIMMFVEGFFKAQKALATGASTTPQL